GLKPYWEEFGVNHLLIRTHWVGMPLATALASMRLISDELLPALQAVKAAPSLGEVVARMKRSEMRGKNAGCDSRISPPGEVPGGSSGLQQTSDLSLTVA